MSDQAAKKNPAQYWKSAKEEVWDKAEFLFYYFIA